MSPRRVGQPIRLAMGADRRTAQGPVRRVLNDITVYVVIVLVFSFFVAFPMYWIFGHWTLWTFVVGGAIAAAVLLQSADSRRRKRNVARAWAATGWTDVAPRRWPFDETGRGLVEVRFAKSQVVRGFPVTILEAFWVGGGMGGAATSFAGVGTIVVVRLPRTYGPAGPAGPASPAAQRAWTIAGDEWYAVVDEQEFTAVSGNRAKQPPPLRPMPLARVPAQIDQVLAVIDTLGIRASEAT